MNRALRLLVATSAIFVLAYLAVIIQFPAMLLTRVMGNFLTDNAFLGIAAVGMTFVIISGGIDLSVGAAFGAVMGVPVARTTNLIYTLSATLAGLAGIVFSIYTSAGYSLSALGVELDAIAAVVIGGTWLTGGYGFVAGTFIGVMRQGLVQTYIVLMAPCPVGGRRLSLAHYCLCSSFFNGWCFQPRHPVGKCFGRHNMNEPGSRCALFRGGNRRVTSILS